MKRKVFSIIGLTAISAVAAFNNPKDEFIRVNSFVQNLVNSKEPELVCHLSEDNILLKNIIDFYCIDVYNITVDSSKKFGERSAEDEVLSTWSNSGGLYVDEGRLIYLHPGNLVIHVLDITSDKTVRYKIDDKAFNTTKITSHVRDVMGNRPKLTDYLHNNSLVKGLYKDNDKFFIVSEIGQHSFDQQSRVMDSRKRKIKL